MHVVNGLVDTWPADWWTDTFSCFVKNLLCTSKNQTFNVHDFDQQMMTVATMIVAACKIRTFGVLAVLYAGRRAREVKTCRMSWQKQDSWQS
jgi:hypothetical protein